MKRKIRILMAKPGLDGHDRGAKVIARTFLDAGMEVIYTGLHQNPAQIVNAAVQEDVDVIALSILSGAHMGICRKIIRGLRDAGAGDKILIVGGTIVEEDIEPLKQMGVSEVFPPGSPIDAGVKYLRERFGEDV
ncbi:MAG: cobalamin B12-binding domain-containing protein [Deltaproteobacteria bacterium]|nr:cobalamin B12-binding domain-containing protein [Deltaproteobacteria bacterium]MBW2102583.1 cobalamin B12-binding domain-containing protein [Deltaproteobacteria bacterium]MBW2348424.1 cobalamin B12-binding domain-containing protein [Deltaproteobacteria bacterium]RLB37370.1 MAG: methylmalonyl-CoA mutase [Deltaproteobacteria bacterium]